MRPKQISIQRAFLKAFDLSFHLVSNLNLVSSIYNRVRSLELNSEYNAKPGIKYKGKIKMKFRTNSNRFNNFSDLRRSDKIEKFIDKSWAKFDRTNVDKTKAQAFFEQAEGYYARNKEYRTEFCDFKTYLQHLTEAHRGKIPDNVLDLIEARYGKLVGPLHIRKWQTGWEPDKDFRNTPRPNGGNND